MRSIELLVRTYPEKTCAEIMQIVEQEKQEHQENIDKTNKYKIDLIKDINENGGYYKGTFGLDQYFIWKFENLRLDSANAIICDVHSITGFKNKETTFRKKFEHHEQFENYGVDMYERVTVKEYNEILDHLENTFSKFWTIIDPKS